MGFFSELKAREYAREHFGKTDLLIVHSEHSTSVFTHWIESPEALIRSWETVCFTGKGGEA